MEMGRFGVQSGLIPLFQMEYGKITAVRRIKEKVSVEDYLKGQKRFKHLFDDDEGRAKLKEMQAMADANIEKYGLLKKSDKGEGGE